MIDRNWFGEKFNAFSSNILQYHEEWVRLCPLFFVKNSLELKEDTVIKELAINEQIKAKEVRLLGENGEQMGIVSISEALHQADEAGLDLVAINPGATPPVCRIMDYGKYKFIAQKREKDAKKKQKAVEIKGMELSLRIEDHDMQFKAKNVSKFLQNGDKVRVIIKGVRGRMANFAHFGIENMNKFYELVSNDCVMEQKPILSGSVITMILAPKNIKQ